MSVKRVFEFWASADLWEMGCHAAGHPEDMIRLLTCDQDGVKMILIETFEADEGDIDMFRTNYNRIRERLENERDHNADKQ